MNDFFILWDEGLNIRPHLCLGIGYSSITDWNIAIYDKTGRQLGDWGDPIIYVEGCDRKIVFAEATVKLAKYLNDTCGGY